jgi:hypothetical protein
MTKPKLGPLADEKPVKQTVELPANVHRNLVAYAKIMGRDGGQQISDPTRPIAPMPARFMAADRVFAKTLRERQELITGSE